MDVKSVVLKAKWGNKMKFTSRSVDLLKPREDRYEVWETGRKGFGLRVAKSGKKSWIFLYRFNGKSRRMTFGCYPAISLADAHFKHAQATKLLDKGIDPGRIEQVEKERISKSPTVKDLAEEYLEKWAKPNKRSWTEDQRMLNKDVVPSWGDRKAKDVKKRDVVLLLESIYARGAKVHANRMLALVRKMFNFALQRDIVEHNPCLGIGKLHEEKPKKRFLTDEEIKTFWFGLDSVGISESVKAVLRLILVTAQRPGEVLGMHTSEIDGGSWVIDGSRTKNSETQRVYLSSIAREIIAKTGSDGFIFRSPKGDKPMHLNTLAHALQRAQTLKDGQESPALDIPYFTPHDLRRTAATHIAEMGFSEFLVGKILNHSSKSITGVYNRHRYDKEKQQAMEAWARKLNRILSGKTESNVLELKRS